MDKLAISTVLLLAVAGSAQAQVSFTGTPYTQDFDTLSSTVSATNTWTQNSTLQGWWAMNSLGTPGATAATGRDTGTWFTGLNNYRSGTGSANNGALWDFGVAGVNAVTDRALGSVGSGTSGTGGDFVWALVLLNNSGVTYTNFTLTYDGEQWRDGALSTVPGTPAAQTVEFDYTLLSALPTFADLQGSNTTGYTAVTALNFTSPVFTNATTTGNALDGNAAANRTAGITSTENLTWAPGQYLVLRWWDNNHPNNDHGLAIDNIYFTADVPTPAAAALLGLGTLVASRRRRA